LPRRFAAVILTAKTKSYERTKEYPCAARQRTELPRLASGSGDANADEQS
jgi:hypothetical protein